MTFLAMLAMTCMDQRWVDNDEEVEGCAGQERGKVEVYLHVFAEALCFLYQRVKMWGAVQLPDRYNMNGIAAAIWPLMQHYITWILYIWATLKANLQCLSYAKEQGLNSQTIVLFNR